MYSYLWGSCVRHAKGRSWLHTLKSRGPRIVPWGTPRSRLHAVDPYPPMYGKKTGFKPARSGSVETQRRSVCFCVAVLVPLPAVVRPPSLGPGPLRHLVHLRGSGPASLQAVQERGRPADRRPASARRRSPGALGHLHRPGARGGGWDPRVRLLRSVEGVLSVRPVILAPRVV